MVMVVISEVVVAAVIAGHAALSHGLSITPPTDTASRLRPHSHGLPIMAAMGLRGDCLRTVELEGGAGAGTRVLVRRLRYAQAPRERGMGDGRGRD